MIKHTFKMSIAVNILYTTQRHNTFWYMKVRHRLLKNIQRKYHTPNVREFVLCTLVYI